MNRIAMIQKLITAGGFFALALTIINPLPASDWAFTSAMPGGHRGKINALVHKKDFLLSAGEDGFLEIWNIRNNTAVERFQVSRYNIVSIAGRPEKDEVCLIESDGLGLYRISAWNYKDWNNIFTLPLRNPAAYVSYSTGGTFIIAAGGGGTGVVLIDSDSGALLQSPRSLTGTVGAVVTGKSERTMLTYLTSGVLSYWDLESGNQTSYFDAPPNLRSPVLFGNSRYLAGVNADGLTIVYTVSGKPVAIDRTVPANSLIRASGDNLVCLIQNGDGMAALYRYTIDRAGTLIQTGQIPLPLYGMTNDRFTAMTADGTVVLGTEEGSLLIVSMNGQTRVPVTKDQSHITEAAVSGGTIAFIAENGAAGFIPRDYTRLTSGRKINIWENGEAYNRVTAFAAMNGSGEDRFIFWQDQNTGTQPVIQSSTPGGEKTTLPGISFRSPIRSADSFGGKILFLDSAGNLSVVTPGTEEHNPFTFFSVGLMDAVFLNNSELLLGRSAVSGNTPFLTINIATGETVPLPYPSQAAVMLHRGGSGEIYAVVIAEQSGQPETAVNEGISSTQTLIVRVNPQDIQHSTKLVNFRGEDTQFALAELSGGVPGIAVTIGGEGAAIYSGAAIQKLDRTAGFPLRLFGGEPHLISLDRDGNIAWHESRGGKLLAVFRLHPNGWTLQTEQRTISGGL